MLGFLVLESLFKALSLDFAVIRRLKPKEIIFDKAIFDLKLGLTKPAAKLEAKLY